MMLSKPATFSMALGLLLSLATPGAANEETVGKLDEVLRLLAEVREAQASGPVQRDEFERLRAEMESRLRSLEARIEALTGSGVAEGGVEAAEAVPDYLPGAEVELFLLEGRDWADLETPPPLPIGYLVDTDASFNFGLFKRDPNLADYEGNVLGVRWQTSLRIDIETPLLLFVDFHSQSHRTTSIAKNNIRGGHPQCFLRIMIQGNESVSERIKEGFSSNTYTSDATLTFRATFDKVQPGYYEMELWLACTPVEADKIDIDIKGRTRIDRTPREFGVNEFFRPVN